VRKKIVFTEIEVMFALREIKEFELDDMYCWATEAAITEFVYGRYTPTARKRVRRVLRELRKKGLVERRKFPVGISWRAVNGF